MTGPVFRRTLDSLFWLAEHYDDLAETRYKGTPRPWREPAAHDADQRERTRLQDAQERADRTNLSIGEHPAPVHVDTLDLLVDVLATADDVAERVSQAAGVQRMPYPASSFASAEPYLRHAAAWLQAATSTPGMLEYVTQEVERLRSLVAIHLHELTYGQTLKASCPWCHGGINGGLTLRVRQMGERTVVVCESGTCDPDEADCGLRHRGHPAWDLATEGEWLAARIEHDSGRVA
jgi:hypothetical protein